MMKTWPFIICSMGLFYISSAMMGMEYHQKDKMPNPLKYSITLQRVTNISSNTFLLVQSKEGTAIGEEHKEVDIKPAQETTISQNLLLKESSSLYTIIHRIPHYHTFTSIPVQKIFLNTTNSKSYEIEPSVQLSLVSNVRKYYFNEVSYTITFNATLSEHQAPKSIITHSNSYKYRILNKNGVNQTAHPKASASLSIILEDPIENSKFEIGASIDK